MPDKKHEPAGGGGRDVAEGDHPGDSPRAAAGRGGGRPGAWRAAAALPGTEPAERAPRRASSGGRPPCGPSDSAGPLRPFDPYFTWSEPKGREGTPCARAEPCRPSWCCWLLPALHSATLSRSLARRNGRFRNEGLSDSKGGLFGLPAGRKRRRSPRQHRDAVRPVRRRRRADVEVLPVRHLAPVRGGIGSSDRARGGELEGEPRDGERA